MQAEKVEFSGARPTCKTKALAQKRLGVILPTEAMIEAPSGFKYKKVVKRGGKSTATKHYVTSSSVLQLGWAYSGITSSSCAWHTVKPEALVDEGALTAVHDRNYITRIKKLSELSQKTGVLFPIDSDQEVFVGPSTFQAMLDTANAVTTALCQVEETLGVVLCLTRPPGHHAEEAKAMGFCLSNTVEVSANAFIEGNEYDADDIGIIDFDVHGGNGHTGKFPCLNLFESTNFPYSKAAPGTSQVKGKLHDVALPTETDPEDIAETFCVKADEIWPADKLPKVFVVSYGIDAHRDDPLGGWKLEAEHFCIMIQHLRNKGVGIVLSMEGGYSQEAQFKTNRKLTHMIANIPANVPARDLMSESRFTPQAATVSKTKREEGKTRSSSREKRNTAASSYAPLVYGT